MKFYGHNNIVLYSEIFYLWFYDFSTYTILAVILWFWYGKIQVRFYNSILWSEFSKSFHIVLKSWFWQPCSMLQITQHAIIHVVWTTYNCLNLGSSHEPNICRIVNSYCCRFLHSPWHVVTAHSCRYSHSSS